MKRLTKALKIIAILLNTIFLAYTYSRLIKYGAHPQGLRDQAGIILIFALPPITLITIALTFHKKLQNLTSVLKIIAIIVNASFLIIIIFEVADAHLVSLATWLVCVMSIVLPVVNIVAVALTYRKEKEASVG